MKTIGIGTLVLSLMLFLSPGVRAQDEGEEKPKEVGRWYPEAEAGFNLTQAGYSDNWSGGDLGSVVWTLILNAKAGNQVSNKINWSSLLKLAYGQTHVQSRDGSGGRNWDKPEKSTDLLDLESILRFTLGGFIDPFVSARFTSQFQDATDPDGRKITLNPLRFAETAGISREFLSGEDRSLLSRLGFALHQSRRKLYLNPAPDDTRVTETTTDGGFEWVTDAKTKILNDRVTWTSKLIFYQPVFFSGKDEFEDLTPAQLAAAGVDEDVAGFTTTMDIDWENIFTSQISKIISVSLYLRWVYDKYDNTVMPVLDGAGDLDNTEAVRTAIRKAGQFKQTLALGVTYRFL